MFEILGSCTIRVEKTKMLISCAGAVCAADLHLCLFVLRLNVPVNNFSVMLGQSQVFLGRELMCLAQGSNTVTSGGIEPRTSRFGV